MSAADTGGTGAGGPGASGDNLALDPETAAAIAGCHDTAARRITDLAASVPNIDGGYATADLNLILAEILTTADQLARINEAAATQIREVADHFDGTDAEVALGFGNMAGTSWPYGASSPTGAGGLAGSGSSPWDMP